MNPFTIGIVQGGDFCDRERETSELLQYARSGNNVVLYSPRRYGKSSLVTHLLMQLGTEGCLTVYVDLFPVSSEQEVVTRLATALLKGIGGGVDPRKFWDKVKGLFSAITPVMEVKEDRVDVSVKFDWKAKTETLLEDVMRGVQEFATKSGARVCVALDEFQEITELKESKKIEGVLRSQMQFHREVSYIFVGSRRRILKDMFTDEARPFYKSAYLYRLEEIPREDFVAFIGRKFSDSGKDCPAQVAGRIYDAVRGYPYYVQKLASVCWERTSTACTDDILVEAHRSLLELEAPDFEGIWSGLALTQKEVLKALAAEPSGSIYAREYLEKYHLSLGGSQKAVKALLAKDLIEKDPEDNYRLTDPVMAEWLVQGSSG